MAQPQPRGGQAAETAQARTEASEARGEASAARAEASHARTGTQDQDRPDSEDRRELPSGPRRVRMVQQREDPRYDGRPWPEVGGEFDVPEWEAAELTRLDEHHSHPVAELADGSDPAGLGYHDAIGGPGAAVGEFRTHRRMGVEDRDGLPGRGEPDGTARRHADRETARWHEQATADAERDRLPPDAAEGAYSGAAQAEQARQHGPETAGPGVPATGTLEPGRDAAPGVAWSGPEAGAAGSGEASDAGSEAAARREQEQAKEGQQAKEGEQGGAPKRRNGNGGTGAARKGTP